MKLTIKTIAASAVTNMIRELFINLIFLKLLRVRLLYQNSSNHSIGRGRRERIKKKGFYLWVIRNHFVSIPPLNWKGILQFWHHHWKSDPFGCGIILGG